MDCDSEIYQTMMEALEVIGDPELAIACAWQAIYAFVSYCNEQAGEASGTATELQR